MTPTEKAVAYTMAVHASPPSEFQDGAPAGLVTMSMSLLAREAGLQHRQTASLIVKRLVAIGMIAAHGEPSKGGNAAGNHGGRTTAYIFTLAVNPDSGVWKTTAAEELAAAAKSSATQLLETAEPDGDPTPKSPGNDGECNFPVAVEPINVVSSATPSRQSDEKSKSTATPQLHEGLPSSSFPAFSDSPSFSGGKTEDTQPACPQAFAADNDGAAKPVVVGGKNTFPLPPSGNTPSATGGGCAPHAQSVSGRRAAPTQDVSLPFVLRSKAAQEGQSQRLAGNEELHPESRTDAITDAVRRRQVERKTPDAEIFREAQAIFDRLRQEHNAERVFEPKFIDMRVFVNGARVSGSLVENPVWTAMPRGADIENDLKTNAEHRHDFAEMYRSLGRDFTLAKWEDFLVNVDHTVTARGEGEAERTYLMEHFIQLNGVSTQ
jgi:hypothetical protein